MSERPLRVALVGLGVIARYYLAALERSPEFELVVACDRDPERLREARAMGVETSVDTESTLARPDLDAAVLTVPNDLHAELAASALGAGLHVCCEKPLTTSVAEARSLVELARDRGRTLFTALHRRYNSNFCDALGQIGDARIVRASAWYLEDIREHAGEDAWYLDPARCGGGCVADNGPNALDAVRVATGSLEVVSADIRRDARGVDMQAEIELRAPSATAHVMLDWAFAGERKGIELELDDGRSVRADFLAGYPAFKSSLEHEYAGVVAGFRARVEAAGSHGEDGLELVELVESAYAAEASRVRG